ncbi:MAG: PGF-pre-PGF domain-containing protein [Nanoarchaeota archaeon]|nr:PGF-pre-PGF domain-containing protein [Nanoarchaeota archaeon]
MNNTNKKERNTINYTAYILLIILLILIVSAITYSMPVPHGIDGNIYELDSLTPVGNNIDFSIHDITTGEFIQGKTKNNGYYSAALNGNNGNTIIIKTWNKHHSSNRTIILNSVMHNVDLLLNMTMPQFPPNITSIPITEAIEDMPYTYQIKAEDENNDILTYSLLIYPYGMYINSNTGLIEWLPENDDVGMHNIIVQVSDNIYTINHSFNIDVINVNDPPEIISGEIISAIEDQLYKYDVEAIDVDNEILYYYLDEKPDGMSINLTTGLIEWLPENDDVGDNNITIRVSDGNLDAIKSFTIEVMNTNDEFIINSTPITTALEDGLYTYDVDAYDIDKEDILEYSLIVSPFGMDINTSTGLIKWIPSNEQVGNNSVVIQISDNTISQNQSFIINVLNVNDAPDITSQPIRTAYVSTMYIYDVDASDPDKDILEYSLLEKPINMNINKHTGIIKWVPQKSHIGNNTIIIEVTDKNLGSTQIFNIIVYDDEQPTIKTGSSRNKQTKDKAPKNKTWDIIGIPEELSTEKTIIRTIKNPSEMIERIDIKGKIKQDIKINVKELARRPINTKNLDKKVYRYIEMLFDSGNSQAKTKEEIVYVESINIQFKVEKGWLEENKAEFSDIILNRYVDNQWKELVAKYIGTKNNHIYFEAKTPGFSYFAISLKDIIKPDKVTITGPKEPHIVSGIIFKNNRNVQVGNGTEIIITNKDTGQIFKGKTGISLNSGQYYLIINGNKGDMIYIEIKKWGRSFKTQFTLESDMKEVDLILTDKGLFPITGYSTIYSISPLNHLTNNSPAINSIIILALLTILYSIYIAYKRKTLKKKNHQEKKEQDTKKEDLI